VLILGLLLFEAAQAQEPLQLELSRRVPVTSAESMAMGSAGMAFANGAKGVFFNPAAPAVRKEHQGKFGLTGVLSLSSALVLTGLEDQRLAESWVENRLDVGLAGRYKRVGVGLVITTLQDSSDDGQLLFTEGHLTSGVQLSSGALGVGLRTVSASIQRPGVPDLNYAGVGWQVGYLFTALDEGVNVGFSYRSRVLAPAMTASYDAPDIAVAPWEFGFGLSRVFIAPWPKPVPMRLAVDMVLEGPVDDAGAIESLYVPTTEWVQQGSNLTLSPRMGLEIEVIEHRLRLRTGTWREASRLQQLTGTWHATAGLELRVLPISVGPWERDLALEFAVDRAAGFTNVNWLTLGFWESGQVEGGARELQ
jgi:hypothetical protein